MCYGRRFEGTTEYIKLTEEVGTWAGEIKQAKLPDYSEVDYVWVYDAV